MLLARANEQVEEGGVIDLGNIGERLRLETLRHHLHDEADIGAAVRKFTPVPTGHVHAAAGVHIDVCRARDGQEGFLMRIKGRPVGGRVVKEHRAASPVAGIGTVVEGLGPTGVMIKHAATARAATVVLERWENLAMKILVPRRVTILGGLHDVTEAYVPATAIVCIIACENVQIGIDTGV